MKTFEELLTGIVEAAKYGLGNIGGFSAGIKYYKFVEVVFQSGVSLLRCDNCNI